MSKSNIGNESGLAIINKLGKLNIAVAVVLIAILWMVSNRYYGPTEPLTKAEIEQHMKNIRHMFMTVGVPDGNGGVDLESAMAAFRKFAEQDDGKPIYMINLMKWRDQAVFNPNIENVEGVTAKDADQIYNDKLFYELAKNASHTAYLSNAFNNAINFGFDTNANDDVDNWGEVGIFRYSSRRDFFNMVGSESYRNIVFYKLAAMGHIAIIPTQPHGLLFNPMPNVPVLLGFVFTIGYLIFLLINSRRKV